MLYLTDAADTPGIYQMANTATSTTASITDSAMNTPQNVAVDGTGVIYVPDYDSSCVYTYASISATAGSRTIKAGTCSTSGNSLSLLNGPSSVSLDSTASYMYICDANNDRIIRFLTTASSGDNGVVVAVSSDCTWTFI
ncbi:unnamed protein product, partial [Rotaria sp. Silwood1]